MGETPLFPVLEPPFVSRGRELFPRAVVTHLAER